MNAATQISGAFGVLLYVLLTDLPWVSADQLYRSSYAGASLLMAAAVALVLIGDQGTNHQDATA